MEEVASSTQVPIVIRHLSTWCNPLRQSSVRWIIFTPQLFSHLKNSFGMLKHSCEHSWCSEAFLLSTPGTVVLLRGFQFSRQRSQVGSRNPRKIGMGVPNILGFVAQGCRKMGVPIFWWHQTKAKKLIVQDGVLHYIDNSLLYHITLCFVYYNS